MRPVSPLRSAKTLARRAANAVNGLLVSLSGASDLCLIVANEPMGGKTRRVLERLEFAFAPLAPRSRIRIVRKASLFQILLARTVVEVDEGLVPGRYRWRLDNVFKVDFDRNPEDGWELCRISQLLAGLPTKRRRAQALSRLKEVVQSLRSQAKKKVYVFGTGPSLADAITRDFSDGNVIVCNTIVRDPALWHHLKPDLVVAGDAIYHFGQFALARAFRTDLKSRLAESKGKTFFVYPELFDAIVQREFAGLQDILVPIPFGKHTDVHVNLCERFELPDLGNVLTILLLPLACTLWKSVWLWGFDGRAPDDRLFWSYSNRHAYPELIPELQEEHPAFFAKQLPKGHEGSHVQIHHGDALDQQLARAEGEGYEFVMMHHTWTETLQKRALPRGCPPPAPPGPTPPGGTKAT